MRTARISAVEYALPARILTNSEIAERHPNWRMPEVARRTGVVSRHVAESSETALDLAEVACQKLLSGNRAGGVQIRAILFCTQTPDYIMPPNACLLQDRLGLPTSVAALDFTLACSGYVYGLFLAKSMVTSGAVDSVLLVTADTYSKLISPDDRGPYTLFGDGAAATLIQPGSEGIHDFVLGTDGSQAACFIVEAGGARVPRDIMTTGVRVDRSGNKRSREQIKMNGPAVLAFVQRDIPGAVSSLLGRSGTTIQDLDVVVFHQASQLATDYLAQTLGIREDQLYQNIARVGNTVSASIPIALRDAEIEGRLSAGDKVLLVGFGVGLSWGACLLTW